MAKDKVFQIKVGSGDTTRTYELVAKDQTAAEEIVREAEARQNEPLTITTTTEV